MSARLLVEYRLTLDHAYASPEGPDGTWQEWFEPHPPEHDAGWVIAERLPMDFATVWRLVRLVDALDEGEMP